MRVRVVCIGPSHCSDLLLPSHPAAAADQRRRPTRDIGIIHTHTTHPHPIIQVMSRKARSWTFGHSSAAHASALFCPDCQRYEHLRMPTTAHPCNRTSTDEQTWCEVSRLILVLPLFSLCSSRPSLSLPPCSILDLPDADLILRCPVCAYQMKFTVGEDTRYEKLSISTKYSNAQLAEEESMAAPAFTRAKVKEICPQCKHPEMSFYTVR